MIKVMLTMYRKPGMSREEFSAYWRGPHADIAKEWPGVRRYFQDHVVPELPLGEPPCDGIAELWFDSQEALQTALGSPEGQRTLADLANFADTERTKPMVVDQHTILDVTQKLASASTGQSGLPERDSRGNTVNPAT